MERKIKKSIMSEKVFIVDEDKLDFVADIDDVDNIVMYRSSGNHWSENIKGEKVGEIADDGNEIHLTLGEHSLTLDYSELYELGLLLKLKERVDGHPNKNVKFLKEI